MISKCGSATIFIVNPLIAFYGFKLDGIIDFNGKSLGSRRTNIELDIKDFAYRELIDSVVVVVLLGISLRVLENVFLKAFNSKLSFEESSIYVKKFHFEV